MAPAAWADPGSSDDVPWRFSLAAQVEFFQPPDGAVVTSEPQSFGELFGDGQRVLGRLELGFGRDTKSGLWLMTGAVGYWRATGHAQDFDAAINPGDSTIYLQIIPISVGLFWRADFLHRLVGLPFVPYARLGYGFASWSTGRLSGSDTPLQGWAFGLEYGGGLQFILDSFDQGPAAEALHEFGLRSTGAFIGFRGQAWRTASGAPLAEGGVELGLQFVF